ncbi:MAG TPA: 50S ribosomal protein L32, partial [Flavobacteriales bacterium]|nr:50S ribosomal protein L32 [Flavobacteriales bacterium]
MPNPKRRFSKTRTAKRRTHQGAEAPTLSTCSTTGE